MEKITPTQDAEDYMIGMAEKAQDDIGNQTELKNLDIVHYQFWTQIIDAMNRTQSTLYQNKSPGVNHWLRAGSGVSGVGFHFAAARHYGRAEKPYGRAELYIGRRDKVENEFIFDQLLSQKDKIESAFGSSLEWERLEESQACRIKAETVGDVREREQWEAMIAFMTDAMCRLEAAIKNPLKEVGVQVKNGAVST